MVLVKIYVNKGKYTVKIIQVEIHKLSHFSNIRMKNFLNYKNEKFFKLCE